jgi:hypothetical protein
MARRLLRQVVMESQFHHAGVHVLSKRRARQANFPDRRFMKSIRIIAACASGGALDCVDPAGTARSYLVDLRADEAVSPRPFDASRTTLEPRPALEGDPLRFSLHELLAKGLGLRPDPQANPAGYRRWLAAARVSAHKLRSVPRRGAHTAARRGAPPAPSRLRSMARRPPPLSTPA